MRVSTVCTGIAAGVLAALLAAGALAAKPEIGNRPAGQHPGTSATIMSAPAGDTSGGTVIALPAVQRR